jgi:hypothetical protein
MPDDAISQPSVDLPLCRERRPELAEGIASLIANMIKVVVIFARKLKIIMFARRA